MAITFAQFSPRENELVDRIVRRAVAMYADAGHPRDAISIRMDISAVHARIPLRLGELAKADNFNFSHDIGGIAEHLDRTAGLLTGHFMPRFALSTTGEG
jgi:hypothetical protein